MPYNIFKYTAAQILTKVSILLICSFCMTINCCPLTLGLSGACSRGNGHWWFTLTRMISVRVITRPLVSLLSESTNRNYNRSEFLVNRTSCGSTLFQVKSEKKKKKKEKICILLCCALKRNYLKPFKLIQKPVVPFSGSFL